MRPTVCFDNLVMSKALLNVLFVVLALTILVLISAVVWLLRQKKNSVQFALLIVCFIVVDICSALELHVFNMQMVNQCSGDNYSNHIERKCLWITCFLVPVILPADFLPYWGFAEQYWELSYRLESIINPFEKAERPKWHKYLMYGVMASALVLPFVFIVSFALSYDPNEADRMAWAKTYFAALFFYFSFFLFVLCLMGYLVYRFWCITNNSQYKLCSRLSTLNLICYSIGTISAILCLIVMTINGKAFPSFALLFIISCSISQLVFIYIVSVITKNGSQISL